MNKKNILAMVLLLVFFIVPIVAAFWLSQHPQRWSLKTVNHGQLLQPLLAIKTLPLQALGPNDGAGHWQMLYVQPQADCAEACQRTLYDMRQVRLALGKNQDQVVRAYVSVGRSPSAETRRLLTIPFQGTRSFEVSLEALNAFLPATLRQEASSKGLLLIVDPQGNAMMVYPIGFVAKDLLADMNRLLMVN